MKDTAHAVAGWYLNQLDTYGLLPVLVVSALAVLAFYCTAGAVIDGIEGRCRTRREQAAIRQANRDRAAARRIHCPEPPAVDTQPGTDSDLLLDAALAYYGPAGIQRLHNAIDQHRKEDRL